MSLDIANEDWLEPNHARDKLFDEILEQLARCDLFSNTALGEPTIFPVYAHRNDAVGAAHDTCVHDLISWLQRIKAGILSDKSALPPLTSEQEDTSALRNIIANQIRLLPHDYNAKSDRNIGYIDKVIVCGSEVLKKYCKTSYASKYIDDVASICKRNKSLSMKALKPLIESFVDGETGKDGFHHVLTEIAFLRVRKSRRPDRHGMVPVALDGAHHLPYLSLFGESDITFKLKSASAAAKHALFFKLLEQLLVGHKDLVNDSRHCYKKVVEDLNLDESVNVSRRHFHNCLNTNMTKMYHKHWSTFSTAMRNGRFNEYAGNLGQNVLEILDQTKAKERREILQWVSPTAAPPMPGKYQDGRVKRLDGTCDWVIKDEKFIQWYESENSGIISLQGSMGMGKTYATSRVIEWIQRSLGKRNHSSAHAYFYCIEQDETSNTARAIMRSIVRQVATGPTVGVPLNEAVINMWDKHGQNAQGYDTTTFDEWENCLSKLITTFQGVTIVLDALDECKSTQQRADLTKLFTSLTETHSNLKIFVSTRPEPDLSRWLEAQPSISMHSGGTSNDIVAFVQDKIAQHSEWTDLDQELKEHMVKTIMDKSQGLFLCAHLQIENLQECLYEEDILDGLQHLPQELSRLYEKLYLRATARSAAKKYMDRALRWVLCSVRPLTSDELLYAISQDAHTGRLAPTRRDVSEKLILRSCNNFLTLDSSGTEREFFRSRQQPTPAPVWRLAHQAVAEFFENSGSCSEERAEMHYEAGKVCLMVVVNTFGGPAIAMMTDRVCPCGAEAYWSPQSHRELQEPLGEYAAHAWPAHMRANEHQESRNSGGLSHILLRFLTGHKGDKMMYERWLQHASSSSLGRSWSRRASKVQRWLPNSFDGSQTNMSPLSLACYLGFPKTLSKLLNVAGLENVAFYDALHWIPWRGVTSIDYSIFHGPLRWSAVALACAYDEVKVLQHLLDTEPVARLGTFTVDEVPPIVAAAIGNSVKVTRELLRPHRGLSLSSSFTSRHGHVLRFAIMSDALQILPMLLDRVIVESPTLKEPLSSVRSRDFDSAKAMSLLLERSVDVNTPLQEGTLLAAAVGLGEEGLVIALLERGADANKNFPCLKDSFKYGYWEIENALEACLCDRRINADTPIARLLVENGATVRPRAVAIAFAEGYGLCRQQRRDSVRDLLRLLIAKLPHPNEIFKDKGGVNTCALNEALRHGSVAGVELLLDRGADPNLLVEVEGEMVILLRTMFKACLRSRMTHPYPMREMIKLLDKAGADFGNLEGEDLNIALAATAWAGLTDFVPSLLERGADPNAPCGGHCRTALGTAAASGRPEAPDILRMLLDKADVNLRLPDQEDYFYAKLVLDYPLQFMLVERANDFHDYGLGHVECLRNWTRSASVLASNGAAWDVDFEEWRECLRQVNPEYESQESDTLDTIQQNLERNRNKLSDSQKDSDEWRVKDLLATDPYRRAVLESMRDILHQKHRN